MEKTVASSSCSESAPEISTLMRGQEIRSLLVFVTEARAEKSDSSKRDCNYVSRHLTNSLWGSWTAKGARDSIGVERTIALEVYVVRLEERGSRAAEQQRF